jgi:hypothetical protein
MKEKDIAPLILQAVKLAANGDIPPEDAAAVRALADKQIGKPVIERYSGARYACPECRYELIKRSRYCPRCGQRLEWMLTDLRTGGKRL